METSLPVGQITGNIEISGRKSIAKTLTSQITKTSVIKIKQV